MCASCLYHPTIPSDSALHSRPISHLIRLLDTPLRQLAFVYTLDFSPCAAVRGSLLLRRRDFHPPYDVRTFTAHAMRSLLSALSRMDCTTMTHLPPSGFIGSMATGRGTRASRFSSACAHCFSHGVIHFSCAFAYYYPRNANHIFRREIFRFRAAFAVSPLALSRSLADSVFKDRAARSARPLRLSHHTRNARQRTHATHTRPRVTHASARTHTRTHAHAHMRAHTPRTPTHTRTRRGPRARAHARPRTGGTSRAAPSAMQTRRL